MTSSRRQNTDGPILMPSTQAAISSIPARMRIKSHIGSDSTPHDVCQSADWKIRVSPTALGDEESTVKNVDTRTLSFRHRPAETFPAGHEVD